MVIYLMKELRVTLQIGGQLIPQNYGWKWVPHSRHWGHLFPGMTWTSSPLNKLSVYFSSTASYPWAQKEAQISAWYPSPSGNSSLPEGRAAPYSQTSFLSCCQGGSSVTCPLSQVWFSFLLSFCVCVWLMLLWLRNNLVKISRVIKSPLLSYVVHPRTKILPPPLWRGRRSQGWRWAGQWDRQASEMRLMVGFTFHKPWDSQKTTWPCCYRFNCFSMSYPQLLDEVQLVTLLQGPPSILLSALAKIVTLYHPELWAPLEAFSMELHIVT